MRRTLFALGLLALAATVTTASAQTPGSSSIRDHRKTPLRGKGTPTAEADKKLSKEKFRSLVLSLKLPRVNAAVADRLFARLDRNNDGQLDQAEMKQFEATLKVLVPSLTKAGLTKSAEKLLGKLKDTALGTLKGTVTGVTGTVKGTVKGALKTVKGTLKSIF